MSWYWLFLFAYTVAEWIIRIVMIAVILRRRFAPSTALAWLVLIMFLPELGLIVYLLVGVNHLGRRRAVICDTRLEFRRPVHSQTGGCRKYWVDTPNQLVAEQQRLPEPPAPEHDTCNPQCH